jgi:hypothetical protein
VQSVIADTLTYGVSVTDGNGDLGHDSITVIFDICDQVANHSEETVRVYPVPSGGEVSISAMSQDYYLQVTDMSGKIISEKIHVNAGELKTLRLSEGLYTLKFSSSNGEIIGYRKAVVIR